MLSFNPCTEIGSIISPTLQRENRGPLLPEVIQVDTPVLEFKPRQSGPDSRFHLLGSCQVQRPPANSP